MCRIRPMSRCPKRLPARWLKWSTHMHPLPGRDAAHRQPTRSIFERARLFRLSSVVLLVGSWCLPIGHAQTIQEDVNATLKPLDTVLSHEVDHVNPQTGGLT